MEEEGIRTTSTVTLHLKREHMGASLVCKVLHPTLAEELEAKLQVELNVPIEALEMEGEELEELQGEEGEEMEVVCWSLRSRPYPDITWVLPNQMEFTAEQEAVLTEDETYDTVSRVTFTPTAEDHGMSITCQAKNEVMEEALEAEQKINVHFAPRVSVSGGFPEEHEGDEIQDGKAEVFVGREAVIDCLVEANPRDLSVIEWFHDGELVEGERFSVDQVLQRPHWQLDHAANPSSQETLWSLTIDDVGREDAGGYTCRAANSIGETTARQPHLLNVNCK